MRYDPQNYCDRSFSLSDLDKDRLRCDRSFSLSDKDRLRPYPRREDHWPRALVVVGRSLRLGHTTMQRYVRNMLWVSLAGELRRITRAI
jgi:hypothetical protein